MTTITARHDRFSAMPAWPTNCGPMTDPGEFTEDAFLGGRLRLRQPRSGHRAGHDAMLLAAATPARSGDRVVDLGAGDGAGDSRADSRDQRRQGTASNARRAGAQ